MATCSRKRDLAALAEVWDEKDVLNESITAGRPVRVQVCSVKGIDAKRKLLLLGTHGSKDAAGQKAIGLERVRLSPSSKDPLENYLHRNSYLEVWSMPGCKTGHVATPGGYWYLAKVNGFKNKEIYVEYCVDGAVECVSREICRYVNENLPLAKVPSLKAAFPSLPTMNLAEVRDKNYNHEGIKVKEEVEEQQEEEEVKASPLVVYNINKDIDKYAESYLQEHQRQMQRLLALREERLKKEEEKAKAEKAVRDLSDECKTVGIAETQVLAGMSALEKMHEQMLCYLQAKKHELFPKASTWEKCVSCQQELEAERTFQCVRGHPLCPNCCYSPCQRCSLSYPGGGREFVASLRLNYEAAYCVSFEPSNLLQQGGLPLPLPQPQPQPAQVVYVQQPQPPPVLLPHPAFNPAVASYQPQHHQQQQQQQHHQLPMYPPQPHQEPMKQTNL